MALVRKVVSMAAKRKPKPTFGDIALALYINSVNGYSSRQPLRLAA